MSSQWVDFAALKQSVDIEQVLASLPCAAEARAEGTISVASVRYRHMAPNRAGRALAWTPAGTCGLVIRLPVVRPASGKVGGNILDLVACMEACSIREAALRLRGWSDTSRETGLRDQLVSKGKKAGRSPEELPRLPFSLRLQWHPYLEQRGIQRQTAAWFGVGYYGGSGFLRGRMVFPIHDERGELVAYAGRTMDGREPRYLFPPGFRKSQVVFNLHRAVESAARQGGVAIVVEGFFDCLKVHQAGYGNVVALMGASVSDRQAELLLTQLSRVGSDAGRRRGRAAGQPGVGRAVAGRVHGLGAGGLATRPTVERGNRTDSAQGERRSWSMKMALQFRFG